MQASQLNYYDRVIDCANPLRWNFH